MKYDRSLECKSLGYKQSNTGSSATKVLTATDSSCY